MSTESVRIKESVRIESTRKSVVVLPPVFEQPKDGSPEERFRKRRKVFRERPIEPAKWDPIPNKVEPTVSFIDRAYYEAIKDHPDVQRLFSDQPGVDGRL